MLCKLPPSLLIQPSAEAIALAPRTHKTHKRAGYDASYLKDAISTLRRTQFSLSLSLLLSTFHLKNIIIIILSVQYRRRRKAAVSTWLTGVDHTA